jgi:hypothetical protein
MLFRAAAARPRLCTHALAFVLATLCVAPASSATLSWYAGNPAIVSFWDPLGWDPAQAPVAGDDLELRDESGLGVREARYLGTVDSFPTPTPAQAVSAGAMTVLAGDFGIDWGGTLAFLGDPAHAGGLSLTSLTLGDVFTPMELSRLTLIDPQLAVSGNVQIGNSFGAASTLRIETTGLWQSSLSADRIFTAGDNARLVVDVAAGDVAIDANVIQAAFGSGSGLTLRVAQNPFANQSLTITTGELFLERAPGTVLDALGTDALATIAINTHDLVAIADGGAAGDMRIALGSGAHLNVDPSHGPPVPTAAVTRLEAYEGATLTLDIDGGSAFFGGNNINESVFIGLGYGGDLALRVVNGGSLFVRAFPFNTQGIANPRQFLAVDSPTSGSGSVQLLVDAGHAGGELAMRALGGSSVSAEFRNGATCGQCNLSVESETTRGSLRIGTASLVDFSTIRVVNSDAVVDSGATLQNQTRLIAGDNGTIALNDTSLIDARSIEATGVNSSIALNGAGARGAWFANAGADFSLATSGAKSGGDLPSVSGASLALSNANLRISGSALFGVAPTLAIGSGGGVDVTTGSIFIADAVTPSAFQTGAIVLSNGGSLWGSGNVLGGVVNSGGSLNPGFSPGTITLSGAYTQSDGELVLEIGGVNAGEYDVLDAAQGASFLGGTLRFERINNFVGVIGAQLDFFAGRAVSFDPSVVFEDNTGFGLAFDLATGIATITRLAVPEPPVLGLMLAGAVGLGWIGRRRA